MLYKNSSEKALRAETFKNPGSCYRGAPFWAWNCKLERDMLLRKLDEFKQMGMGGFHIHCRSGLGTPYMSDEFMSLVTSCEQKAKEEGLLCWLYDEDRWPSGFGGGYVTSQHCFRARFLVFAPSQLKSNVQNEFISSAKAVRSSERRRLSSYRIALENGCLRNYQRLSEAERDSAVPDGGIWDAYLEISGENPWFNNQAYVNTLDKKATEKFIEVTHERYYKALGGEFGKTIPAIFTDEPQFTHKECLDFAEDKKEVILPFTDDFEATFKKAYGLSLLDHLPELIWELPDGKVSRVRYCYHDHLSERFASAYADTIGKWCREHGLMLTGHMMDEPTLGSQTGALGDCMRSYRAFDIPGIDMLCDRREFTTAKQAQSACHQYGREGVMSEIYGVTNWDFDFRSHKLAGDWQAALGVTLRVPHLTWLSMEGEAKRDYPASIGCQSPWYREYSLLENHYARLNTALTRGEPDVHIGAIHPIESYWLHWGPKEQTADLREEMDVNFGNLTEWLLFGLCDFDFIAESLLPSLYKVSKDGLFHVGKMAYDTVLVPNCETLRLTTLSALSEFRKAGGRVIFAGEPARYLDAQNSNKVKKFAESCENIPFNRYSILQALGPEREIDVRTENGERPSNLFYQMRRDGENRWLYICHVNKMKNPDIAFAEKITITLRGKWSLEFYDTMTGEIRPCSSYILDANTHIVHRFSQHDSLLLKLCPEKSRLSDDSTYSDDGIASVPDLSGFAASQLPEPNAFSLSEPNVLLLDTAEYALDTGDLKPEEELLRIDNNIRKRLGYPLRMEALAQPWTLGDERYAHELHLRFKIKSQIEVFGAKLAVEQPQNVTVFLNDAQVNTNPDGYFVDESIKTLALPKIPAGESTLSLIIPFNRKTNVEWCYILGKFGVKVAGKSAVITAAPKTLVYGDWCGQGLPFYAGNVSYEGIFKTAGGTCFLEISHFRSPLLQVSVDGKRTGTVAFAPYIICLGELSGGVHSYKITAFGNRVNTFGAVHNSDKSFTWFGPNAWRTTGSSWAYEYQLKRMGILTTPRLFTKSEK